MADGTTVDSLQIEIEASSAEAEKRVDALAAALERLKKVTTGFGNISDRIRDIGASASESPAAEKTKRRRQALDRATREIKSPKATSGTATQAQFPGTKEISQAIDSTIKKYDELIGYLEKNKGKITRDAASEALREIQAEKESLQKIVDRVETGIGQTPKNITTLYAAVHDLQEAEKKFKEAWANPAPVNVNWDAVKKQTDQFKEGIEAERPEPTKKADKSIEKTQDKIKSLKQAIKELDAGKLQLTNELAKAEIQAVKTDGKLADLRRRLDDLKGKGAESIAKDALADAEARFSKFSTAAEKSKEKINDLKKALEILKDYNLDLSAPGIEQEIREYSEELKGLIQAYRDSGNAAKLAGEEMKNSMAAVNAAMKGAGESDSSGEDALKKKLNVINEIKKALNDIKTGKFGDAFGRIKDFIPSGVEGRLKSLGSEFGGVAKKALGLAAAHPILATALLGVGLAAKKIGSEMKKLAQAGTASLKKAFDFLAAGAKKLTSALKNLVASGIGKAASGLKSLASSIGSRFTKPFTNAISVFSKWKSAIGRVAFYRAISLAIRAITEGLKTGMDNLYQYSRLAGTEFAPAMNSLATSALYLKNSLGAMAAPLIQAVAPAIDFLIDKFVALINVIGKAFAMLTGKSVYTQAKKHAVEYGDAANAASKATQKFLLGIDELTILDNPAGGGGGAASDFGSMFEEVEIDQDQFDWVKQIREAIENGEWRSVGELVANKLNEIVDNWDSYGWGAKLGGLINNGLNVAYGFLTTFDFVKFGSKVADGLNGLFDTVDWDLLGRTFAAKWNALFDFIYGFATTLKWHEIGLDISQAINGFLDELDAAKAARAVSAFVTGLFDMLNTAIAETNWNVLGDKLGQFISEVDWKGAIYGALSIVTNGLAALKEGLDSFLQSWNWQNTAQQTYTAVNQAFSDVDWGGLGTTLSNAFTTAFNFLRETIAGIKWESIGSDIAEFLNGIDWAGLLSSVATTIATAFNAVVSTLSALVRDLEWEEVGKAVGNAINDFFAAFDWVSFFTGLAELAGGVMNGISAALETIDWDAAWASVKEGLDAVDWGSLVESAGRLIVDAFVARLKLHIIQGKAFFSIGGDIIAGLFEGIGSAIAGVGEWLKTNLVDPIVNGVKDLFGIHSPSTVFADLGGNLIAGLLEGISGAWGSIVEFFGGKVEALKEFFSGAWENIKTTASTAWENIKTNLGTTWESIKTSAGEKFTAVKESISTAWENVKTSTGEKWESIKSTLSTTWENLKTTAGTTFESIKSTVVEKWESIKSDTSEKWDRVKTTLSDAWDNMKSTATTKLADIKGSISDTWGDIVSSAVSWGKDLCANLAEGIRGGISKVTSAVSSVASKVRDFLHFTEPDVGPLSDFHTYMPDMLDLMSRGIKDNTYKAVNAASDLADEMSRTLGNIEPVEPKFSVHEDLFASVQPHYSGTNTDTVNVSPQSNESPDSMEVINAMFAVGQQIVNAINENSDRPINIDWSSVASGMTSMQNRQNMMYGKTLQNY